MANKPTDLRRAILDLAGRGGPSKPFAPPERPSTSRPPPAVRQASRVGKASVTGYFAPEVRRQLRRLAADADTTIQALLGEALNDLFAKYGVPELVERD